MIRPYRKSDQPALLQVFRLNTPKYFAPAEEQDFIEYLEHLIEDYFVIEQSNAIIGGGGVNYFEEEKGARISWDFIHPDAHGKGLGRKLVQHRIDHIKNKPHIETITVRTSQLAYRFYQKFGFELVKTEKDFWAEGLDLYQMDLKLK